MTINCFDAYADDNDDNSRPPFYVKRTLKGDRLSSAPEGNRVIRSLAECESSCHALLWSTRFFGLPDGSKYPLGLAHVCQFDDAGITCTCYLEHYNVPFVRGIPRLIAVLA